MTHSARLKSGVAALVAATQRVLDLQRVLAEAKEERRKLAEVILPDLFAEEGVTKLDFEGGVKASLVTVAVGSLPKEPSARAAAIEWFAANGYEDLVKTTVSAAYGRGERHEAQQLAERLAATHAAVKVDEGVHAQTLGKICRERVAQGLPTPLEMLGVTVLSQVKLRGMPDANETSED